MQLAIEHEDDMVPAMLQIEYLAGTDGKTKEMCSTECLKHLATDELTQLEQTCLAHCSAKLGSYYSAFYAQ